MKVPADGAKNGSDSDIGIMNTAGVTRRRIRVINAKVIVCILVERQQETYYHSTESLV